MNERARAGRGSSSNERHGHVVAGLSLFAFDEWHVFTTRAFTIRGTTTRRRYTTSLITTRLFAPRRRRLHPRFFSSSFFFSFWRLAFTSDSTKRRIVRGRIVTRRRAIVGGRPRADWTRDPFISVQVRSWMTKSWSCEFSLCILLVISLPRVTGERRRLTIAIIAEKAKKSRARLWRNFGRLLSINFEMCDLHDAMIF